MVLRNQRNFDIVFARNCYHNKKMNKVDRRLGLSRYLSMGFGINAISRKKGKIRGKSLETFLFLN